ncbi:hypothetical protein TEA_015122 [Camellia sinensis var. sinensis]|uniref:Uncharacterized protein n=1 Tax=Camellia sinensis var. sinensis TaxID=542762 RepID=A0A4S4EVF0_CAMSN|nr:hypothetical protein TEA_015122 [Camellia sinensis var. sinensis]
MACSSGSCESGCYKDKNSEEDQQLEKKKAVNGVVKIGNDLNRTNLCIKCKSNQTIATTIPTTAGDASRFCSDCFRTNLFGKFRFAVTSNAMISPEDNVLVAFSGDTSSSTLLLFTNSMVVHRFHHLHCLLVSLILTVGQRPPFLPLNQHHLRFDT